MPLDVAGYDAVLKEVYEKTIQVLLNRRTRTLDMYKKESGSWEGRQVRYPLNVRGSQGVMATSENGTLPDAGAQVYVEHVVPIRYNHGRIQLSIQVIKHSRSNRGAFKRAMDQEMQGLVRDLSNDRNRQMFGWGSGVLALINEATPTGDTTLIVDAPGGVAGATHGNRFLNVGMNVAFINPANGAIRGQARNVTAINTNGTEVTLNSAPPAGTANNDYIVRAAKSTTTVVTDTAYNREPMGLLGLIDDGTFVATLHGVVRATYPIFNSVVVSSVGPLSADILQRGLDVADQVGEGSIKRFICHHSVRRAYLTLMESDRRYATAAEHSKPDAGTAAAKMKDITFGDIPWQIDKDAPFGTLFGVDNESMTRWAEVEGEWADDDGTILMRLVDTDAYEGRYRIFDNFSLDRPASCVRFDGITATVVVAHIY
ncbi:hypothetical protein [Caudoviricetes sp.]|nr:hypothetical protein [Caudoviricetes sp.]